MNKKKIIVFGIILSIVLIISLSTFALFVWSSPNTNLTLEVGSSEVLFKSGNDINVNNIGPILDYNDGEKIEFQILNKSDKEMLLNISLNIKEISDNLKEESFKYKLLKSSDGYIYSIYKEGNFKDVNVGNLSLIDEDSLPNSKQYYLFIIYIDGNMDNPVSMMNNKFRATLDVGVSPNERTLTVNVYKNQTNTLSYSKEFKYVPWSNYNISLNDIGKTLAELCPNYNGTNIAYKAVGFDPSFPLTGIINENKVVNVNCQYEETGRGIVSEIKALSKGSKTTVSAAATTDEGVWEAPDDYGTSYYFRGAVENNYVKFADFYWRIMRIEGNDNIRLIYDGTSAHKNGESSSDRHIGTSKFNTNDTDNAYVGYMYGSTGSSNYASTHANNNSSDIKTYLENWYDNKLLSHSDVIAEDTVFCNDRSLGNSGNGAGKNPTYYRWNSGPWKNSTYSQPQLTCPQLDNDGMSVASATKGNKKIIKPIGLITADEAVLAGGYSASNFSYYLYTGQNYWTMSPNRLLEKYGCNSSNTVCQGGYTSSVFVNSSGNLNNDNRISIAINVRPVISLKPTTQFIGNGTQSSPFEVVE